MGVGDMTPEEMAAGCVEHGVGHRIRLQEYKPFYSLRSGKTVDEWAEPMPADDFINDGRVVLAMLDIVPAGLLAYVFAQVIDAKAKGKKLGPAIIEAILQALGSDE